LKGTKKKNAETRSRKEKLAKSRNNILYQETPNNKPGFS
jgi:hypothetical protein